MSAEPITFHATVNKVQTVADGGVRITLDVPEIEAAAAFKLANLRDRVLGVAVVEDEAG